MKERPRYQSTGLINDTLLRGNVPERNSKNSGPPSVVITDFSDDDSELRSIAGSPELRPDEDSKRLNGFPAPGKTALKWQSATKKVTQAVTVTQAINRPQTRQKKIRRQLNGSKAALPVLPIAAASFLLVANCLVPGIGTMVAGFTFCCCATTYDKPNRKGIWDKVPGLICTNLFVGLAQLLTVSFLLAGWFWSIAWGVTMVQLSLQRRKEKREGSDWFPEAADAD